MAVSCKLVPTASVGFTGVIAIEDRPLVFPVPDIVELCGLLLAESVTVSFPVRFPVTVGVKVTLMVHFAFEARVEPQVLV